MSRLLIVVAALSILASAIPAKAGQCTTTCRPDGFGGSRCVTNC